MCPLFRGYFYCVHCSKVILFSVLCQVLLYRPDGDLINLDEIFFISDNLHNHSKSIKAITVSNLLLPLSADLIWGLKELDVFIGDSPEAARLSRGSFMIERFPPWKPPPPAWDNKPAFCRGALWDCWMGESPDERKLLTWRFWTWLTWKFVGWANFVRTLRE